MPWILVTGGARRLGAQICKTLAAKGHNVLVHYRSAEKEANALVDRCRELGVEAEVVQGDFSTAASTQKFLANCQQTFPEISGLVHNVGCYLVKSATETSPEEWEGLFQTNLHAPFAVTRGLLPSLKRIVTIGVAGVGRGRADTYSTAYTLTKEALLGLTRVLAKELAPKGICVNMVSPGYLDNAVDLPDDLANLPMGRAVETKEVADLVAYLMSDAARSITGQNIEVAGGVRL